MSSVGKKKISRMRPEKKIIINVQINDSLLKCSNKTSRDERGTFIYLKKCVVFVCTCERKEEFFSKVPI